MGVAVSGHARWLLATARQIRAATVLSTGWGEFLATDGTALEWEDAAGHGAEGRSGIRLQPNRLYPVSYTHLDVYKRQDHRHDSRPGC